MEENQMVDAGLQRHGGVIGNLVPPQAEQPQNNSTDGHKLSSMIMKDNKKFYIDLVSVCGVCETKGSLFKVGFIS